MAAVGRSRPPPREVSPCSYYVEKATSIARNGSPKIAFHCRHDNAGAKNGAPGPAFYGVLNYAAVSPNKHLTRLSPSPRRTCLNGQTAPSVGPGSYNPGPKSPKQRGFTIPPRLKPPMVTSCGADAYYSIERFDRLMNSRKICSLNHSTKSRDKPLFG